MNNLFNEDPKCPDNGSLCHRDPGSTVGICSTFCGDKCGEALENLFETYNTACKQFQIRASFGHNQMLFMSQGTKAFEEGELHIYVRTGRTGSDSEYAAVWPPNSAGPRHERFRTDKGRLSLVSRELCKMRAQLQQGEKLFIRIGMSMTLDKMMVFENMSPIDSATPKKVQSMVDSALQTNTLSANVTTPSGINLFTGFVGWGVDVLYDQVIVYKTFTLGPTHVGKLKGPKIISADEYAARISEQGPPVETTTDSPYASLQFDQ